MDFNAIIKQVSKVVVGKEQAIRLSLACLLARGHLLIEDVPGVGKTLLAHALARTLGLEFNRIQFTSDMMPADVIGVSIYATPDNRFQFHPGPVFRQVLLADEINRATPKTQSALLEAMEERQITVDGETHPLPEPFFVVATQNPGYQIGIYPLPESQLDRFLMRIHLGYPDGQAERQLLAGGDRRRLLDSLDPACDPATVLAAQEQAARVTTSDALLDYLQALIAHTRNGAGFEHGLSPRAGLAMLRSAQAWALLDGREFVMPEDLQAVFPAVAGHRLLANDSRQREHTEQRMRDVLESVAVH